MPRASLPSKLKNFRSFEVLITQTTEDEIMAFFMEAMRDFEDKSKYYTDRIHAFLEENMKHNPYLDQDFDFHVDNISMYDWVDEKFLGFNSKLNIIRRDLELCVDHLWNEEEDEDKCRDCMDWINDIDRFTGIIKSNQDEFKLIDKVNYKNAYSTWRTKHAKRLESRSLANDHKFHHIVICYKDPHIEGVHYYLKDGVKQYFNNTCKICLQQKEWYYSQVEYESMSHQEYLIQKKKYEEEQEAKRKEEEAKEAERIAELPVLTCECCGYSTKNQINFDTHLESKEHLHKEKVKKMYCATCGFQARTDIEYQFHINTNKHKKLTGQLEETKQEYHCEACNYTCVLKQHWNQHCASKKHNELVNKDNK
jgi:hypothetical protein